MSESPGEARGTSEAWWRERNRRLWLFLVFAPYVAFLPSLLLLAVRDHVSRPVGIGLAALALVLVAAYLVIGGVGIFVVNRDRWRMRRDS